MAATANDIFVYTLRDDDLHGFTSYYEDGDRTEQGTPAFGIPLTEINTYVYPNYRSKMIEMQSMKQNLLTQGQLQPIVVSRMWNAGEHGETDDTIKFLGVVAGFRRVEALRRIAAEKFVDRYNKERGHKPADKEYLNCDKHPDWLLTVLEQYPSEVHEALSQTTVDCSVQYCPTKLDAMFKNTNENEQRENCSLGDLIMRIAEMSAAGASKARIAEGLNKTAGGISQLVKAGNTPEYLNNLICSGETYDAMSDKEKLSRQDLATMLTDEMKRRMSLPQKEDCALKLSHVRKIGEETMHGTSNQLTAKSHDDKFLHPDAVLELLKDVCCYDDTMKMVEKFKPTMDHGVLVERLKHARVQSATIRKEIRGEFEEKQNAEVAASLDGVDTSSLVSADDEEVTNEVPGTLVPLDSDTAETTVDDIVDDEDFAGDEEEDYDSIDDRIDDLVGGDDVDDEEEFDPDAEDAIATGGRVKLKGTSNGKSNTYKPATFDRVAWTETAKQYIVSAVSDSTPMVERLQQFSMALSIYEMMEDHSKAVELSTAIDTWRIGLEEYIESLEKFAKESNVEIVKPEMPLLNIEDIDSVATLDEEQVDWEEN